MDIQGLSTEQLKALALALRDAGVRIPRAKRERTFLTVKEVLYTDQEQLGLDHDLLKEFLSSLDPNMSTPFYVRAKRARKSVNGTEEEEEES